MKHNISMFSVVLLTAVVFSQINAQTKCIWIVNSQDGTQVQKIGLSLSLVKLLSSTGGDFDVNGVKMSYESLLHVYRDGSTKRIEDSTGKGETKIYGGKFDQEMKESSEMQDQLIVESSDSGSQPTISKVPVKSVGAVGIVLAMIGSKDLDRDIDRIESALEQGGVLYIRDEQKDSRLWIYVN
ncbi:MAG TPA: hypothetical protein VMF88_11780 [Bacteroidota bacterium]|nr:hypothetical protein [Bacteroidota bacterium]